MSEPLPSTEVAVTPRPVPAGPLPAPPLHLLRAAAGWLLPAVVMVAGAWVSGTALVGHAVLVAEAVLGAGRPGPWVLLVSGVAAGIAVHAGMHLFERLLGAPGPAVGVGVTLQLGLPPLLNAGIAPGWVVPVVWAGTLATAVVVVRRGLNRRPPVIPTAEPLVVERAALDALVGRPGRAESARWKPVSGRFRMRGWPRTALQAVELDGDPPAEIDSVVSLWSSSGRGTAFVIRNDGTTADLVTNEHLCRRSRTVRVGIAGTVRRAVLLPRPDPARVAELLREAVPERPAHELAALAEASDLRVVRIDSRELAVAPLQLSDAVAGDDVGLSVGYPLGGIPRLVWPAAPTPVPVVGVGRLVRDGCAAQLWSTWRIQGGNSGGPVLVREAGVLRVAAVTYLQHATGRSLGDAPHIPALVVRANVVALSAS
jgi:S1-C subfamily serine protease